MPTPVFGSDLVSQFLLAESLKSSSQPTSSLFRIHCHPGNKWMALRDINKAGLHIPNPDRWVVVDPALPVYELTAILPADEKYISYDYGDLHWMVPLGIASIEENTFHPLLIKRYLYESRKAFGIFNGEVRRL